MRRTMSTPVHTRAKLFDLTGQTALVTGGSRGLGLQMAEALGEAGAKIMLTSRKAADLEEAAADLQAKGIDARWMAADASRPGRGAAVVAETMQRLGRIDILVNNAGATWGAPAEDYPLEAWDKVMNLNIRSLFLFAQAVAKASMIPRKHGRIINVASIAGLGGSGEMKFIAYGTSKGAAVNFTRTLAGEWGELRHHRQRAGAGLLPQQDDQGHAGGHFGADKLAAQRRCAAWATTTTSRARRCCSPAPRASTSPGRSWRSTAA
jgi:NADP-dependent 3-hydroxy acid dehydrogenase YdfG